jgi:hypothetical protein
LKSITPEYLAGFFDGEGHAILKRRTHRSLFYIDVEVGITNLCYELLQEIQGQFGGKIYRQPNGKGPIWRYRLTQREETIAFLQTIIPHLIVKQERVSIVLKYLLSRPLAARGIPYDENSLAIVDRYFPIL